jgi:hypothetical protein
MSVASSNDAAERRYRLTANVTQTTAVTSFSRDDVSLMPSLLTSVELRGVIGSHEQEAPTAPHERHVPPSRCQSTQAR